MEVENKRAKIADYLLQIKAIKLNTNNPYTWASGWKSPIYCDNRISLSYPEIRSFIKLSLAEEIKRNYPEAEAIVGVATAGIAQAALVADFLKLPCAYVRPEPKSHGRQNQLEGDLVEGTKVVVLEDLISTGKSSLLAAEVLRNLGLNVLGMAAIFTYGFELAEENFKTHNCTYFALSNYEVLLQEALKKGYIKKDELVLLSEWRKNPATWQ
jgi:orotate phosphoribosyltransferase